MTDEANVNQINNLKSKAKSHNITKRDFLKLSSTKTQKEIAKHYHIRLQTLNQIAKQVFKLKFDRRKGKYIQTKKNVKQKPHEITTRQVFYFKDYNKKRVLNRKSWAFQVNLTCVYKDKKRRTTVNTFSYTFDKFDRLTTKDFKILEHELYKKFKVKAKIKNIKVYFNWLVRYADYINCKYTFEAEQCLRMFLAKTRHALGTGSKNIRNNLYIYEPHLIRHEKHITKKPIKIIKPKSHETKNDRAGLYSSKRLGKKNITHPFIAFDVETDREGDFIVASVYGKRYKSHKQHDNKYAMETIDRTFTDKKEFQDFLMTLQIPNHQNTKLIAHNTSFDLEYIREIVNPGTETYNKSRYIYARLKLNKQCEEYNKLHPERKTRGIEIWDFMNIIPMSLKELIDNYKHDIKQKYNVDIGKPNVDFSKDNDIETLKYRCHEDAKALYWIVTYIEDLLSEDNQSPLKKTIGETAITLFKNQFLKYPLKHHKHETIEDLEYWDKKIRKYYYGGKVHVFKHNEICKFECYDVNSLYPSVMCEKYPILSSIYETKNPQKTKEAFVKGHLGFLTVDVIATKGYKNGLFPVRTKDGHIIYPIPIDKPITVDTTSIELKYALSRGWQITKYHYGIFYSKSEYLFKPYVDTLYAKRQHYKATNQKAKDLMTKLLLNSLYGKFGQRIEQSQNIIISKDDLAYFDVVNETKKDNQRVEIIETENKAMIRILKTDDNGDVIQKITRHTFVELSAFVTAYGRVKLNEAIDNNIDNVIYCDTDSIYVSGKPKGIAIDDTKLGCWSKDDSGYMIAYSPKNYRTYKTYEDALNDNPNNVKIKGIPKKHIRLTPDNYQNYIDDLSNEDKQKIRDNIHRIDIEIYIFEHANKLKESLRRGLKINKFEKRIKIISKDDKQQQLTKQFLSII